MKWISLFMGLVSSIAFAEVLPPDHFASRDCVPETSVVCVISQSCVSNTMYYELSTTFQKINSINVDAGEPGLCVAGRSRGSLAMGKLKTQAKELLDAGVCKVVMDNISP